MSKQRACCSGWHWCFPHPTVILPNTIEWVLHAYIHMYACLSWVKSIVCSVDKLCVVDCSRAWGKKLMTQTKSRAQDFPPEPISWNSNSTSSPQWYQHCSGVPLVYPLLPLSGVAEDAAESMTRRGLFLWGTNIGWKAGEGRSAWVVPAPQLCRATGWRRVSGQDWWACRRRGEMPPMCLRMCAEGRAGGSEDTPEDPAVLPCKQQPLTQVYTARADSSAPTEQHWPRLYLKAGQKVSIGAAGTWFPRGPACSPRCSGPQTATPRWAGEGTQPHLPTLPL